MEKSKTVTIICEWCRKEKNIPKGEYKRKVNLGTKFFCGLSCSAKHRNNLLGKAPIYGEKICKCCKKPFTAHLNIKKSPRFCSRSCASLGSVTEKRREAARLSGKQSSTSNFNIVNTAKGLRSRESWKYENIEKFLISKGLENGTDFIFEFPLEEINYVYDIAFPRKKLLVELDGDYHFSESQLPSDIDKEEKARSLGWAVTRLETKTNCIIGSSSLQRILELIISRT